MPSSNIAELAFAIQSAKGSAAAASAFRIRLTGGAFMPEPNDAPELSAATSTGRVALSAYVPAVRARGEPEAFVRPNFIGALLYAVLGAKAVTGASDPFTHTFTVANTQPWLTIWRSIGGVLNERFVDCKISSLQIRSQAGEPVIVRFGIIGISPRFRTSQETTVTVETSDTFMHSHAAGALLVEGVAVTEIDDVIVNIDSGNVIRDSLASYGVKTGPRMAIEAIVSQRLVSTALWNRMHYGSASPANDTVATGVPLELAGSPAGLRLTWTEQASPERSLRLDVPRVILAEYPGIQPNPSLRQIRQAVTYRSIKPASGSALTATLKNSRSSY
jgi:hypothetical protein